MTQHVQRYSRPARRSSAPVIAVEPDPTDPVAAREWLRQTTATEVPLSAQIGAEDDLTLGDIQLKVLRPEGASATIVYLHDGGWVLGDVQTSLANARRLAGATGAVVVSVGYRLAPEHRFPAAFDDALAATQWAHENAADLGGGDGALVVAGEGVGGQLAASVAIARRDEGARLDAQLLLYPVTDVTGQFADEEVNQGYMSRRSVRPPQGLTVDRMNRYAQHYVEASQSADWRVSPMRAASLAGVAPAVVHTATLDVLRTEGNFYADKLRGDSVAVLAHEFPTVNHSYHTGSSYGSVADSAAVQVAEDLAKILAG